MSDHNYGLDGRYREAVDALEIDMRMFIQGDWNRRFKAALQARGLRLAPVTRHDAGAPMWAPPSVDGVDAWPRETAMEWAA